MINYLGHELCKFQFIIKHHNSVKFICNKCNIMYYYNNHDYIVSRFSEIKPNHNHENFTCSESIIKQIIE